MKSRKSLPTKSIIGSQEAASPAAPRQSQASKAQDFHQTHGGYTPPTGPITNVSQLYNKGQNIGQGEAGSFSSMADYTRYLRSLSLHEIRSHAIKEKIVPIDDTERLIRRLETQWTSSSNRYPGRSGNTIPARQPFSREQIEAQEKMRSQMLKR